MRLPSWSTILPVATFVAALGPPDARAVDLRALTDVPRVWVDDAGVRLARQATVIIDDPRFAIDLSAMLCAQPPTIAVAAIRTDGASCQAGGLASRQWLGEQTAMGTVKLPQWSAEAPSIDLALRAWRSQTSRDGAQSTGRGAAAEAEFTQAIGRHEVIAGYSYPIGAAGDDRWRTAWAGASVISSNGTQLQFVHEWSHDERSASRDSRYTMRLTRRFDRTVRANAYITHVPSDVDRRWRAGMGIDWSF